MSEDGGFSEYVAVRKFLADTGMKPTLIYNLLRAGKLDGFQLDGTTKWVIHRNAFARLRQRQTDTA